MTLTISDICRVVSVSQDLIQVEVLDHVAFKTHCGRQLMIGSYIKVSDDDGHAAIAIVQSYRILDPSAQTPLAPVSTTRFVFDAQPVGFLTPSGQFRRGGQHIAIPPTKVTMADETDLKAIYTSSSAATLVPGHLANQESIAVPLDGDLFFAKHIAVVGSTGSGKSCTVAQILQEGIRPSSTQLTAGVLNNSHIVIFDIHGEYASAFPAGRVLTIDSLNIPYWLMNAEELEEMFILSAEENSHNQVTQFRHAVLQNKKRHNPTAAKISYDSPLYFSLEEVFHYITNMNAEVIGKKPGEGNPTLAPDRTQVPCREDRYFQEKLNFVEQSNAGADKASNGPFKGDFDRFVLRLRTVLDDDRMAFLLRPRKADNTEFVTEDLEVLITKLIGYATGETANITIIDLSGIPFEVLSLVVSLISRIIFDVGFHLKKGKTASEIKTDIPILAVYEEAHIYAPNSQLSKYRSVTKAIERIAKEGRKYGICLMIVSQRRSEISETIFSQCNNFVAMRLTNPADQAYVKRLLPDAVARLTEALPSLEQREALIIGDAISLPTVVKIQSIENRPNSNDIHVLTEWRDGWRSMPFARVLSGMKRR
jgi:uncharacterized protein